MARELILFFAAAWIVMLPGITWAVCHKIGRSSLENWIHGACLGLASAVYVASVISHFDLRWFYPAWLIIAVVILGIWYANRSSQNWDAESRWMALVLGVVAVARYAPVLSHVIPNGVDPQIFMILARKIQLAQHSVSDWMPFDPAKLNYPSGAHVLVAVLSSMSGLPVHTVFKDLIPLLGVLMTGEVFILARGVCGDAKAALFAALAYGTWAGDGSIGFYNWGGLPNEFALLFLLAMLSSLLLEPTSWSSRVGMMAIFFAAVILVHHHTLLASVGVLALVTGWLTLRLATRPSAWAIMTAVGAAALIDLAFLVPYVAKIADLPATNVFHSEWRMDVWLYCRMLGLPFVLAAAAGLALSGRQRMKCHPAAICTCIALVAMFVTCEYVLPIWLSPHWRIPTTVFSPSHFLNDLPCFAAVFAGVTVAVVQKALRLNTRVVIAFMLLTGFSQLDAYRTMAAGGGDVTADYVLACDWINQHTPADTILVGSYWGTYLAWRQNAGFWLPDSERQDDVHQQRVEEIELLMQGKTLPKSETMRVLQIVQNPSNGAPILWRGISGLVHCHASNLG